VGEAHEEAAAELTQARRGITVEVRGGADDGPTPSVDGELGNNAATSLPRSRHSTATSAATAGESDSKSWVIEGDWRRTVTDSLAEYT
jgi:hypothetical protein